jgi:hypothetical protein
MQSTTFRVGAVAALVVVAVVLFVVLSGDEDNAGEQAATTPATTTTTQAGNGNAKPKPKPETTTIVVKGSQPVGGVQELTYTAGGEVRFDVRSDAAEEVHVHGYDLMQDTVPGRAITFEFPADIEGIFEVELEETHTQIAELTVEPG